MAGFFKSITDKITIWSVIAFAFVMIVGMQLVFSGLGFFIPSFAGIKLGSAFYLILIATALYWMIKFLTGTKVFERRHVILILAVVALVAGFFYVTQTYTPQFFSIAVPPQFSESISQTIANPGLQSAFTYSGAAAIGGGCPKGFVKCSDGSCEADLSLCPKSSI